jgi:uncharacterized protein
MKAIKALREFQVFVKPGGSACNLACDYCYYLSKGHLWAPGEPAMRRMPIEVLETYIRQQIEASPNEVIRFSWHGGEPTLVGLTFFRRAVALQKKYQPPGRRIINGVQTNGTLLDQEWCRFLAEEGFRVGLSLDGPQEIHDRHRFGKSGRPSFRQAMRGFDLLQLHGVEPDILGVVTAQSVRQPETVYAFYKHIGAQFISLLPLVEPPKKPGEAVGPDSVGAEDFGDFLCEIFDEWKDRDIGRVQVEIFEEAVRTALGQRPSVCIFRPTCGDVAVIERNGDFYACDHFVMPQHRLGNIMTTHLGALLESAPQRQFGRAKQDSLTSHCQACDVLAMCHGGCPKDRFIRTPRGEFGLNYLCGGYKRFFTHCQPFLTALAALHHARP